MGFGSGLSGIGRLGCRLGVNDPIAGKGLKIVFDKCGLVGWGWVEAAA